MPDGILSLSAGSIYDRHISSSAAIGADKQKHAYEPTTNFGLESSATPAAKTFVLRQCQGAGTLRAFYAGLVAGGSSTSITFDLKKNGTTVLSSVVTVANTDGNYSRVAGTISTASYSAGDVFTVVLATSSTTGATGPYATAVFEENTTP